MAFGEARLVVVTNIATLSFASLDNWIADVA
jgi:hypothetical protein